MVDDAVVVGTRYPADVDIFIPASDGGGGFDGTPYPTLGGDGGGSIPYQVDCAAVRSPTVPTSVPDNAKYYLPRDLPASYYTDAINHIADFGVQHNGNFYDVRNEIVKMYTDKNYRYFVDFKRWGSDSGPDGSVSAGEYTYFSNAAQASITANAFEAFGNYFFGVICTYAGFSPDQTHAAAAVSSAQYGGSWFDDPQDRPHVDAGISAATRAIARAKQGYPGQPLMAVKEGC